MHMFLTPALYKRHRFVLGDRAIYSLDFFFSLTRLLAARAKYDTSAATFGTADHVH